VHRCGVARALFLFRWPAHVSIGGVALFCCSPWWLHASCGPRGLFLGRYPGGRAPRNTPPAPRTEIDKTRPIGRESRYSAACPAACRTVRSVDTRENAASIECVSAVFGCLHSRGGKRGNSLRRRAPTATTPEPPLATALSPGPRPAPHLPPNLFRRWWAEHNRRGGAGRGRRLRTVRLAPSPEESTVQAARHMVLSAGARNVWWPWCTFHDRARAQHMGEPEGGGVGDWEGGVRCGVRAGERPHPRPRANHAHLFVTCYFADKPNSAIVVFSAPMSNCQGWQF